MTRFASEILKSIEQSNVWKLRKIFEIIGEDTKNNYLNEYWIADSQYCGYTFLHFAIYINSNIEICKYLLSQGANPNQYDLVDNTPLHLAVLKNNKSIIRLLIQYGADPLIKNENNKLCHELLSNEQQQQIQSLIAKCINDKENIDKISSLPFQNSDAKQLQEICAKLDDDSNINCVLQIVCDIMNIDSDQKEDTIKEWNSKFTELGIKTFSSLLLPEFEDWAISITDMPSVAIYCLENILKAYSERLTNEIIKFNECTKIMDILSVANSKCNNKFGDKLKEYESKLIEQGINTLSDLQNITLKTWKIMKIYLLFCDCIREIINLYNMINCKSNITITTNERNVNKNGEYILFSCDYAVSCITTDNKFIHIATMDGNIKSFDLKTFDYFHEFTLFENENDLKPKKHIPLHMKFLNNKYEQLITAGKNGNVCCWYLHSNHPNKRGKNIRIWKTHKGYISDLQISKNSELIFTIGLDGFLRVRNLLYNGNIIHSMQLSNIALTTMSFISKTSILIGTENGIIMQVDIRKEKITNIYKMNEQFPIRSLCLNESNNYCYFSFGEYSIGLLDISENGEWKFIGKFVEGFDHHKSIVNYLYLRNEYLWSCSEDNCIRIWDLKCLKENIENIGKKKGNKIECMPNCIKMADSQTLCSNKSIQNDNQQSLVEIWCSMEINGIYNNGIQNLHFIENKSIMVSLSYQTNVIAYNLKIIDNILPQKHEILMERRKQLNEYEKELQNILHPSGDTNDKADNGKKKGKGKKKKKNGKEHR
eukprot:355072_1